MSRTTRRPPRYTPDPTLPPAWLVDMDGTLALLGDRHPFAWDRVGEDTPAGHVVELVQALHRAGFAIVVVSGRDGSARADTEQWLAEYGVPYDALLLRAEGDMRKDTVVKAELFDTHVRHRWNVRGVFDDRDQVVAMWRSLGLPCLQVAPGDF